MNSKNTLLEQDLQMSVCQKTLIQPKLYVFYVSYIVPSSEKI